MTQGGPPKAKYKTKYPIVLLSAWYSQSSSMVNVFGDSVESWPGNLQMAKKVFVTKGKFKDYMDEILQSYDLTSLHVTDYTRNNMGYMFPPFVFMTRLYMYWTMLPRWRLAIGILK